MKNIFVHKKGTTMAEAAITLPIIVLLTFALVNMAMAGFAAVAASNAANYGARIGSVAQTNQINYAVAAAQTKINQTGIGDYLIYANGGGTRGSQIVVTVEWSVPNYIGGLMAWFGKTRMDSISGSAQATFRQEGW